MTGFGSQKSYTLSKDFFKFAQTCVQMSIPLDMKSHRLHFLTPPRTSQDIYLPRKPKRPGHPGIVSWRKADFQYCSHVNVVENILISQSNLGTT